MANAQIVNDSPYLFDVFQDAIVFFKDGTQYHEKMNYNLLMSKFYFINSTDSEVKVLSNSQDISAIKFGNRLFYIEKDKGLEIISTNPILYVQYAGSLRKEASKGGYGQTTETTSIRTYGGVYGSQGDRYVLDPEKLILGRRYNIYWIERGGKRKSFSTFKQFFKLYPNSKDQLDRFIKENRLDFNNLESISKLCSYADSL
ncbi:hypothetical protein FQ707_07115 [Bacteroidaceae bacterium HV4-6-C5C]|nr:hypothetical protein FQ707_07115 [Bacteroidaceae bacterium HV4-6-C5C]